MMASVVVVVGVRRVAGGEAFQTHAAETATVTLAEFGADSLAQLNLRAPATGERRAADKLAAARLADGRLAANRKDETGEFS